ncbi:MAG: DUF3160 domain-containing protein [Myxococcales bacterium]
MLSNERQQLSYERHVPIARPEPKGLSKRTVWLRLQRSRLAPGKKLAIVLAQGNSEPAVLGQRYTVDSHVLTRVVCPNTQARRMMPNPLDLAWFKGRSCSLSRRRTLTRAASDIGRGRVPLQTWSVAP